MSEDFVSVEARRVARELGKRGLLASGVADGGTAMRLASEVIDLELRELDMRGPDELRTRPGLGVAAGDSASHFVLDGEAVRLVLMNQNDDAWLKALQHDGFEVDEEMEQYARDTEELLNIETEQGHPAPAPWLVKTGVRVMGAYPDRYPGEEGRLEQNNLLTYDPAWMMWNGARVPVEWYQWETTRAFMAESIMTRYTRVREMWEAMLAWYRERFEVVCAVCLDGGGRSALQRLGVGGIGLNDARWLTDAGCWEYMQRALEVTMGPGANDEYVMWEVFNEPDVWRWWFETTVRGAVITSTLHHGAFEDWAGRLMAFIKTELGVKGPVSLGLPGYDVVGLHPTPWGNVQGPTLGAGAVGDFAGGHFYERAMGPGGIIEGIEWQMGRWPRGVARFDGEMGLERTPAEELAADWAAVAAAFPALNVGLWGIQTPGQAVGLCLNARDERPAVKAAVAAVRGWIGNR